MNTQGCGCGTDGLGDDDFDDVLRRGVLALILPGGPDGPGHHLRRRLGGAFLQVRVDGPGRLTMATIRLASATGSTYCGDADGALPGGQDRLDLGTWLNLTAFK